VDPEISSLKVGIIRRRGNDFYSMTWLPYQLRREDEMQKIKTLILSLASAVVLGVGLVIVVYVWLDGSVSQAAPAAPLATTWYVDPAGDDDNSCSSVISPCQTVGAAIFKAADDDTIMVAAGIYTEILNTSEDLTIIGAGRENTILDGNQAGRVLGNSGQLMVQNLTIRNGLSTQIYGGGVYNTGALTLSNTLIISNSSGLGGGINNRGILLLQNSAVISNSSTGSAGGIYNNHTEPDPGVITITNSLIAENEGNSGGGVYNRFGSLTIVDSTIRDNTADQPGIGGGGIYAIGGTAVLSATTVHSNETVAGGGGIVINQAIFTITNSTISNNSAVIYGGIYIQADSQTTILNSTIAYNQKTSTGGAGGIFNPSTATIHWKNSIVANNDGYQCQASGTWVSDGHNLSSDNRCGFNQPSDLPDTAPLLAPLADYGGPTPIHALLPGSPAIDTGDGCPPTDQRGVSRPVDGDNDGTAVCDIGSYEARNQITISDVSVAEGDSGLTNAVLTVTLAPTSTQAITVDYATVGGTAVSGDDFNAISGTLTFTSGQNTQFITVTVNGDTDDEADETFIVNLSNAQVADLVDGQATGTIVDDDGLPSLVITDQTVDEGNSGSVNAVFEVTLSPASALPVTVDYTTTDDTAVSGSDYTAISGTLTFTPSETSKFITVTVYGDLIDEGASETFTVGLSAETNASLADGQGLGTILDDDLAVVSISASPQVIEGDAGTTPAVFTVTLSTSTAFTVTVDYATEDGYEGAVAGSDYEAISGTLSFSPGEMVKLINVNVIGDTIVEPDERFLVRLSNPDPISAGANASNATIVNDDFRVYLPLVIR
jgi:hypothetical protein